MIFLFLLAAAAPCSVLPDDFCFSPAGHCDERLVALFAKAEHTIDVAIYSLNRASIVDALIEASERGVVVRVLLDNLQSHNAREIKQLRKLNKAGIESHHAHHRGIMHAKVAIVDGRWAESGSFNFTDPATEYNDEVMSVLDCPAVAERFEAEFSTRWSAARKAEQ